MDGLTSLVPIVADMVANTEWVKGRERADWRGMDLNYLRNLWILANTGKQGIGGGRVRHIVIYINKL